MAWAVASVSGPAEIEARWRALVAAALLGTERGGVPADLASLAPGLERLTDTEPERALLDAAAVLVTSRRAGWQAPVAAPPLPAPARPETAARCSERAEGHLSQMLAGQHREVLPAWLAALARAGRRVPESTLPELLALGANQAPLQPAIWPVLGERGRWLAGQHPAWAWAAGDEPEMIWQSGQPAARLALLRRLRHAEPARARAMLAATWAEESGEARADFIATLGVGLTADDEACLEAALADRRREVRQSAADLLARLPGSALVARQTARLDGLLSVSTRRPGLSRLLGGRPTAEIGLELPVECDEAMRRDGVDPRALGHLGERAGWVCQMLGTVPPRHWVERWGVPATELVDAALRSDWTRALIEGWRTAVERHGDAEFAAALFAARHRLAPADQSDLGARLEAMIDYLPERQRDAAVIELQSAHPEPLLSDHPAVAVLRHCRRPWSLVLTRAVLAHIGVWATQGLYATDWAMPPIFRAFALAMAPLPVAVATAGWQRSDEPATLGAAVEGLLALLDFRHHALQALTEETAS